MDSKFKVGDRVMEIFHNRRGEIRSAHSYSGGEYHHVRLDGANIPSWFRADSLVAEPPPHPDDIPAIPQWNTVRAEHFYGARELTTYAQALPKVQVQP